MPSLSPRSTTIPPIREERVFAGDAGRLWSAACRGEAVVFTCISDGRQSGRAIAVEAPCYQISEKDTIGDETLRAWLDAAPRIGTLS
jgi:hypothetical protein